MASEGPTGQGEITRELQAIAEGDRSAHERLVVLIHDELRAIAGHLMKSERASHTLQPTALVNEVLIRFLGLREPAFENRRHFFAAAAKAMRRLLVDHARRRNAERRGHGWEQVTLPRVDDASEGPDQTVELLSLHHALERLEARDARQARIIELRYFGGLTVDEAARELAVSPRTVKADWAMARAWLFSELST